MPAKVAIVTPASLRRPAGDALRPLQQARGLWAIGWRDFVLFSREPDPAEPFEQERIDVRGPAQFVPARPLGCALIHAHQNAGLFLEGRLWADFHGFAPLESRRAWLARPASPRAAAFMPLAAWATRRLARRAERIVCAAESIAESTRRAYGSGAPPLEVIRNCLDPAQYAPTACAEAAVGIVGSFTTRWGRPAFEMTLRVARLAPDLPFRLVGTLDAGQRRRTVALANVEALGPVDESGYARFLRSVSIALLPYAPWCVGGGSRQKLLQAAASAQAVVATPAGLEGFEAPPETLIGRTPAELAACLSGPLADGAERRRRGLSLRRTVEARHDLRREAQRLAELYDQALSGGPATR